MDYNDILGAFKKANIKPISLVRPPEDNDNGDLIIKDGIDSFIICMNSLEIPIAYIYAGVFDEDEFEEENVRMLDVYGGDETINLINIVPELKAYKKHIGEHYAFELSSPIGNRMIRSIYFVEWWDAFSALKEKALQHIQENSDRFLSEIEQEEANEAERQQNVINDLSAKLNTLSENKEFRSFILKTKQTQRAITAYAVESLPELNQLDNDILKAEINKLIDKVRIRKILGKST